MISFCRLFFSHKVIFVSYLTKVIRNAFEKSLGHIRPCVMEKPFVSKLLTRSPKSLLSYSLEIMSLGYTSHETLTTALDITSCASPKGEKSRNPRFKLPSFIL